jgi:membrane protease YdiL (CAAX protease family)
MNSKKLKTNSNNYHPVSAVVFSLIIVFILPIITAIFIGVTYSLLGTSGTDSAFEVWMQQNPVEVSILSDEKTIISPVESAVSYLITVPLQIWFIFWLLRRRKIDLSKNLGLYHFNRNALIYSLVAYVILYLVLTVYSYAFQISPPEEFIKLMKATPFVLNFLMVVIGAPIVEELLFRGFLFSQLKTTKLGVNGSIILTSLIWTSIHLQYDLFLLIPIFLLGLFLGYLMHKYNSLYLVIIVHAVHNLQATLFIEFFYDYFY